MELYLGQQTYGALDGRTGLRWGCAIQHLSDVTFEDLTRHAVHASACSKDLCHDLLAGFALLEHADDATNLPLDAPKTHLNVGLLLVVLRRPHSVPLLTSTQLQVAAGDV